MKKSHVFLFASLLVLMSLSFVSSESCTIEGATKCDYYALGEAFYTCSGGTWILTDGCGSEDPVCSEAFGGCICTSTSCQPGQICSAGVCIDEPVCIHDCSYLGQKVCSGSNSYRTCGYYDADSCLDLSPSIYYCDSGDLCSGGNCYTPTYSTCGEGQIITTCYCGGILRSSGYCCGGVYQTTSCGCTSNLDCTDDLVCDTTSGDCVECIDDSVCDNVCDTNTNTCVECTTVEHCSGDTPFCNTDEGICVECVSDANCDGNVCDTTNGICVECLVTEDCEEGFVCNPETNICDNNYCEEDGDCDAGYTCNTEINQCEYDCVSYPAVTCNDYTDYGEAACVQDSCGVSSSVDENCGEQVEGGTLNCFCAWEEGVCVGATEIEVNHCGNNLLDLGEQCDGSLFSFNQGLTNICQLFDNYENEADVSCNDDCTYDFSACNEGTPICGNGVPEEGEVCDNGEGNDLNNISNCGAGCQELINGAEEGVCGNGALEAGESCEGIYFTLNESERICSNFDNYETSDSIMCNNCRLDFSNCYEEGEEVCGNGVLEGNEECEFWIYSDVLGCDPQNCMYKTGSGDDGGVCYRTSNQSDDTCDNDGFLTYSWTGVYKIDGVEITSSSNPDALACLEGGTETIRCPDSYVRLPFFSWFNVLIALTLIGFIYYRKK